MKHKVTSPFQTVVVGIDFSPYSKIVVKQAVELAHNLGAKISLVHAASKSRDLPLIFSLTSSKKYSKSELDKIKLAVERYYHLTESQLLKIHIANGAPHSVVLAVAKKERAPLIVVGSQGMSAVSRFVLGSEAEKIALLSHVPVWVHRGDKVVPLHQVLVPTDLSVKSRKFIQLLEKWTDAISISPRYVFIRPQVMPLLDYEAFQMMTADVKKRSNQAIRKFLAKSPPVPISSIASGNPASSITALGKKYDVIAMNPHSKTKIFKSFGRTTSKVIRLSDKPVLVVKT